MSDKKIEIGFLGPKGTFSYESLITFLNQTKLKNVTIFELTNFIKFDRYLISDEQYNKYLSSKKISTPLESNDLHQINDILNQLYEVSSYRKIFIPIENSIGGSISGNMDILFVSNEIDNSIVIEAEHIQPIRHAIANITGSSNDIKSIASHEQPIRQCSEYITTQLITPERQEIKEIYTPSTVAGVEMAKNDKTIAAIASHQTLIDAGLKIIAQDIQDNNNNATRFILVGRDKTKPTGDDKTSIAITLSADKAGALYEVLGILANSTPSINMTKIESRPTKDEMGEYWFFIDIEGHREDPHIGKALEQIKAKSKEYRFLGSYPRFRR